MFKNTIIILVTIMIASPAMANNRPRRPADQQSQGMSQKKVHSAAVEKKAIPKVAPVKATKVVHQKQVKAESSETSNPVSATKIIDVKAEQNTWRKGKNTVVQLKGQASEDSARCKTFQVRLEQELEYHIECIGQQMNAKFNLESSASRTVSQKDGHVTVTQYGYLTKKPRISKDKKSTLKVPFVEQIIHIKRLEDGQLSFYFESFKEDEFGRIVQDGFVQAHSLTNEKMKISAY